MNAPTTYAGKKFYDYYTHTSGPFNSREEAKRQKKEIEEYYSGAENTKWKKMTEDIYDTSTGEYMVSIVYAMYK